MLRPLCLLAFLAVTVSAPAEQATAAQSARDLPQTGRVEEPKPEPQKTGQPAAASATAAAPPPAAEATAAEAEKRPTPPAETTAKKEKAAPPAAVLPKMEVKKGRITVLDQQLAEQEKAIARERRNTKVSDVDKTLNDSKIAKPLAIFGGESSQFRQHVANERVSLMEDEKDIIEAIAHAKTKEEKAELKKQLQILRAYRREMDKSLR